MFGGSKQEQLEHRLDHKLNASSDGIDMDVPAKVISSETVYTGRIFHVDDMRIALTDKQGKEHEIGRQVLRHAPCVVMLVHDMSTDRYLIDAALRELAEETGVVPDRDTMGVDFVGDFYSSEGMTDELAHIMVLHLGPFRREQRHFDADEHVESAWIPWSDLAATRITSSNSMIAIQHEALRRLIARNSDKDKPSLFS